MKSLSAIHTGLFAGKLKIPSAINKSDRKGYSFLITEDSYTFTIGVAV